MVHKNTTGHCYNVIKEQWFKNNNVYKINDQVIKVAFHKLNIHIYKALINKYII